MKRLTLLLLFVGSSAWAAAQQAGSVAAPAQTLPVCRLDAQDPTRLAVEPCATAPPIVPRRAVPQVIGRMPAMQAPPPVLRPQTMPPATHAPVPGAPLPVNSCDSGGCRDASGMRHDGGVGNATLDAKGRVCHRNGAFLQCF
ncbi:hypothetical protein [Janthinobacterium sp. RB2R34]|uniref:hypothetical protein n=1 Tax=Janthinobacterium sp. RB2R34 TaxID=3424193 RepID=UPI003F1F38C0